MRQDQKKQKGSLILSEGRSGSNWLGSLTNGTKVLGNSEEWFARQHDLDSKRDPSISEYVDSAIERATTENGYFCVKLFPAHLHQFNIRFGEDLMQVLTKRYACNFVALYRHDRLRQAISYARGLQTTQWTSGNDAKKEAEYDFAMIARCYFLINRSYDFWDAYVQLQGLDTTKFYYEDLLPNPHAYVSTIADHAGIKVDKVSPSPLKIQRDDTTEQWISQFEKDRETQNIIEHSTPHRPYHLKAENLLRFLRKKPMKPYPFMY